MFEHEVWCYLWCGSSFSETLTSKHPYIQIWNTNLISIHDNRLSPKDQLVMEAQCDWTCMVQVLLVAWAWQSSGRSKLSKRHTSTLTMYYSSNKQPDETSMKQFSQTVSTSLGECERWLYDCSWNIFKRVLIQFDTHIMHRVSAFREPFCSTKKHPLVILIVRRPAALMGASPQSKHWKNLQSCLSSMKTVVMQTTCKQTGRENAI